MLARARKLRGPHSEVNLVTLALRAVFHFNRIVAKRSLFRENSGRMRLTNVRACEPVPSLASLYLCIFFSFVI